MAEIGTAGAGQAAGQPSPGSSGSVDLAGGGTPERRRFNRRRTDRPRPDLRLVLTLILGVGGGFLLVDAIQVVLSRLQGLLIAVLVSFFLSFAMEPAVQWLSRRGMRRGFATALVFAVFVLGFAGFLAAMAPVVIDQVERLVDQGPQLRADLAEQARRLPGGLGDSIADFISGTGASVSGSSPLGSLGSGILGFGSTLLGGVVQFLTILLVTFYLVADGPRLRRTLAARLGRERQENLLAIWELAVEKTGGYVYSRLLIAVASAAFHSLAFTLIGLPYAIALGVWVGVISSLIPVVGTYLAGALPVAVALASEPITAVWAVVAVVVYQQLENYLVQPRVTAHAMALHPAVAFLAVLVGGALLGVAGALLALPAAAIIGGLVSAVGERHEVMTHGLLEDVKSGASAAEPR